MKVSLQRLNDAFHFEAKGGDGVSMQFDANPEIGGSNLGVRPMQALLMSIGGCSAIDIIMILKKQRQEITDFKINIDGDREADKEPALWTSAHVVYHLEGNIDPEKAKRACELSMEKYCSVSKTLEAAGAKITWEVTVNESAI